MLQAKKITKTYPETGQSVLRELDFFVAEGEFVAVTGRSGSGKSTLLNILSSLVLPDSGEVLFEGANLCACAETERVRLRRDVFATVFQQHNLMPYLSALENVLLPCLRVFAPVRAEERRRAQEALEQVRLGGKEASLPQKLSGGEQQRVAIARALARGARLLFADEPTGSLDSVTGDEIMRLLRELNRSGVTLIMVTHNPEYAARADRRVVMEDGRISA